MSVFSTYSYLKSFWVQCQVKMKRRMQKEKVWSRALLNQYIQIEDCQMGAMWKLYKMVSPLLPRLEGCGHWSLVLISVRLQCNFSVLSHIWLCVHNNFSLLACFACCYNNYFINPLGSIRQKSSYHLVLLRGLAPLRALIPPPRTPAKLGHFRSTFF